MGVIKDGAVSGFLPSIKAFAIHYPGYPSSMSCAIETLGGTEAILKAHCSQSDKLELHFRPEDPYSHPAFGELQPCNNLLLKISRKKSIDEHNTGFSNSASKHQLVNPVNSKQIICCPASVESSQPVSQNESELIVASKTTEAHLSADVRTNLSADIVARVLEAHHFTGMVDYQHVLAVHADVAWRKKRKWTKMELQSGKGGLADADHEDLMILVPPLFSPKDVPEKLVLRPSVTLSMKKKLEGVVQQRWEMGIEPCFALDFNIEEIPKKVNWEDYMPKGSDQWEWQLAVSKLFDERPIWPKESLSERLLDQGLRVGDDMLRRLLFRTAYYFSSGPFFRFCIRKGYDPRKDPDSRLYQRIDFRVPRLLRNYCETNAANGLKHRWGDICAFRVFPYKCQTSLQLCELADDYIQQEIRKPSKQTTCTSATGWFSYRVLDSLRLCVAVRFLSVYPETGAEDLLKSTSDHFEKSKRMHFHKNDLKLDADGRRPVNKDTNQEWLL
ncbi:uncharacterized protein LOC131148996 isoform X2 [Malania oleifera]|uniref:uncharacterized protein LOC131148996 isoform X2 n=1 Tax=Malania oleifera TaxID=397392 RepID=UPI0025ADEF74|nr:uncharacterized protein LOC131148996 isoform X2 [Malania oleifera]